MEGGERGLEDWHRLLRAMAWERNVFTTIAIALITDCTVAHTF